MFSPRQLPTRPAIAVPLERSRLACVCLCTHACAMLAASRFTHILVPTPRNTEGLPYVQSGLCSPPSATLTLQSTWCQSTSTHEEAQAGARLYTTALPLPAPLPTPGTAEPHSPLAPAPACEPLQHRPAGSPVLQRTALPRAPTDYPLSLRVKLGGKLKQREMQTSAAGASQGALFR